MPSSPFPSSPTGGEVVVSKARLGNLTREETIQTRARLACRSRTIMILAPSPSNDKVDLPAHHEHRTTPPPLPFDQRHGLSN
jgi:hypothetical protein